ncbi:DNA-directed RNA polymerase II subunit GRINL1A [Epargyreus clarus]|uniref:DNA-directed RNA polymerase II subunit GRINL1A n=1 Tax=Epargyreus clarus TaxID=520877 RepID=UPI003C2F71CC
MTVMQTMKKINKRIPGFLPPPPKTEIDGKITDLSSKTITELLELKERQEKLLNNKSFINKLADKGAKIQAFLDKVVIELKSKQEEEQTCQLLSNLNLNKESVENVEWKGKIESHRDTYLDSDDDSEPEDVMHILSQNTQEKKVITTKPETLLVTPQDLINIGEQPYVKHIVDITEHNTKPKVTGQFKPFKTTVSDVHKPEKEILRRRHKHWEVTAATPPPIIHGPAKVLTIEESLKLQQDYNTHLKEVEAQHAAEKLLSRTNIKMAQLPDDVTKFGKYRNADSDDTKSDISDAEGSDKEVHDEEPERGGVIFTVMK